MMEQTPPQSRRYEALDSLRGVCACAVALYHFGTVGYINQSNLIQNAGLFVDFFFALSGFVVSLNYAEKIATGMPVRRFMWLRLGRIYPLHAVMMIIFAVTFLTLRLPGLTGTIGSREWLACSYLSVLALVQIFVRGAEFTWNGPSWSIAAELWTYLIFGLLFKVRAHLLIPLACAIMMVSAIYMGWLGPKLDWLHQNTTLLRALSGFSAGYLASRIVANGSVGVPSGTAVELATVGVLIAALSLVASVDLVAYVPSFFLLAVLIFAQERGAVSRILRTRALVSLGAISFSIYMVHILVQIVLRAILTHLDPLLLRNGKVAGGAIFADSMSGLMLVVVIATAMLSYRFIEQPARSWSRKTSLSAALARIFHKSRRLERQ